MLFHCNHNCTMMYHSCHMSKAAQCKISLFCICSSWGVERKSRGYSTICWSELELEKKYVLLLLHTLITPHLCMTSCSSTSSWQCSHCKKWLSGFFFFFFLNRKQNEEPLLVESLTLCGTALIKAKENQHPIYYEETKVHNYPSYLTEKKKCNNQNKQDLWLIVSGLQEDAGGRYKGCCSLPPGILWVLQ